MLSRSTILAAAVVIATTSAVACGPPTPLADDPSAAGTAPTGTQTADATDPSSGGSTAAPVPTGTDPAPAPKAAAAVPLQASQMLADLQKIGIDLKNVPELKKIPLAKKKKLMPLFQKSLGMDSCEGCHVEGDFKTETKNMKMARGMWDNYVRPLRDDKGGTLFCDSCHNGKEHMLPRGDKDAMNKFMTEQYEQKLSRADGEDHGCTTCHTDTMEFHIFKDVWGIE
jgi:hypothetical protein